MKKPMIAAVLAMALAAALVMELTRLTPACAPLPFVTVFTGTTQPDQPLGPYTRGRLGVLQPGYERVYLYVAYRNLAGRSFDRAQALALWGIPPESAELLDQIPKTAPGPAPPLASPLPQPPDWPHAWIDARNQVPNVAHAAYLTPWAVPAGVDVGQIPTPDGLTRTVNGPNGRYSSYLNCPPQAFRNAIDTMKDRSGKYDAGSTELVGWVEAQDQVFSNCLQGEKIPEPLPADASPLARADRNYQIASAYFYAGDFPQAQSAFAAIAGDHVSPWSPIGEYLVARAYIRQATVGHDDNSPDMAALASAETQLRQVLDNPKSADLHASAQALLDYVEVRLHPEQRARELAEALMRNPSPAELARDVHDYTFLLDKLENEQFANFNPAELQNNRRDTYRKLAELRAYDDLTDWILTFQLDDAAARDHAYEKWQQTNSPAWLVAAITKMPPGDPRAPKLIEAAQAVQTSAPGYASVTFHRFRLMTQSGERAAVLPQLNRLLAEHTANMPRSALNSFLAMRMTYASDLAEFLKFAQRVPVEIGYEGNWPLRYASDHPSPDSPWFDSDALLVLNQQMTSAVLTEVAGSKALPVYLRREVARAAWTRAFLLGDDPAAVKLAPVLGALQPELRPDLEAFTSATTPDARRFAGTLLILRFPGLRPYITSPERSTPTNRIDNLRENWWGQGLYCAWPAGQFGVSQQPGTKPKLGPWPVLEAPLMQLYPTGTVPPSSFLSHAETADAQGDWRGTRELPVASTVLGNAVLAWVRNHPDDPRAPEALALAVRAGHFGCADPDRWKVSKAAFDLLHDKYPASSWAKQTKYWYR